MFVDLHPYELLTSNELSCIVLQQRSNTRNYVPTDMQSFDNPRTLNKNDFTGPHFLNVVRHDCDTFLSHKFYFQYLA